MYLSCGVYSIFGSVSSDFWTGTPMAAGMMVDNTFHGATSTTGYVNTTGICAVYGYIAKAIVF